MEKRRGQCTDGRRWCCSLLVAKRRCRRDLVTISGSPRVPQVVIIISYETTQPIHPVRPGLWFCNPCEASSWLLLENRIELEVTSPFRLVLWENRIDYRRFIRIAMRKTRGCRKRWSFFPVEACFFLLSRPLRLCHTSSSTDFYETNQWWRRLPAFYLYRTQNDVMTASLERRLVAGGSLLSRLRVNTSLAKR